MNLPAWVPFHITHNTLIGDHCNDQFCYRSTHVFVMIASNGVNNHKGGVWYRISLIFPLPELQELKRLIGAKLLDENEVDML